MCILCVIQKWSRRVATMLPWLVIPLIGLWLLSQLLPPAFRFEITSPRLACVFVLLFTLFWYEVLMPQLSAWRVRRNARLRERKRFEAIELQKLRKTATRRCRNCLTPYKDQNPGGGRFMCSYCGHISKRPVLDLQLPADTSSGIIKDLVGKGGKLLNGKGWSDNGWMGGQDFSENGNWVVGSIGGKSGHWRRNGSGIFGSDENCMAEKSYSSVVIFACKLLTSFFMSIRWLLRKIFRVSSSGDDASSDAEHRAMLSKRGEHGANYHESRGEKARRKAEEKRQARLEKEMLEEEERKQREEVARLVEERRKLRDVRTEAEKEHSKSSPTVRDKDSKKEAERKRQERRREKDKGSSKSNSDVEELEKRAGKESDRKRDFDRRFDVREHQRSATEKTDSVKNHGTEMAHGVKNVSTNNYNRANAGTRYLDRMRGTLLSSSKAFSGGNFFGKGVNNSTVTKENKSNGSVDNVHHPYRRDFCPPERISGKSNMNGDDRNIRPVLMEPQPRTTPKKSWQQLFTRSTSPAVPPSNVNVISRPNTKSQAEVQNPQIPGLPTSTHMFDNPINLGLPSPFTLSSYTNVPASSSLGFSPTIEPMFSRTGNGHHDYKPEEPELFEDPCYVPDPVSLLGPVSESLDNFQLDLGTGFTNKIGLEEMPHALKNVSVSSEITKPSPIESPLSRLRVSDEKQNSANWFPGTPKAQDALPFSIDDSNVTDKGTWQMWNSSPLGQDGLVGGPASWLISPEQNRSQKDEFLHSSQQTMMSLFGKEESLLPGAHSPQKVFPGGQNGGSFSPVTGSTDQDPWLQNAFFPPLSGSDAHYSKPQDENAQREVVYGSPMGSATNYSPFELSSANGWPKKDLAVQGSVDGIGKSPVARPHIGGLYPTPDVQSLWSFD